MFRSTLVPSALVFLAAGACSGGPTEPAPQQGNIRIQSSVQPLTPGADTTSLVFNVRNLGSTRVNFSFGSTCHLAIRLRSMPSGRDVYPGEVGGWLCAAALSGMVLLPGEGRTASVLLHGITPLPVNLAGLHLDAGDYSVTARFTSLEYTLQSEPMSFSVR